MLVGTSRGIARIADGRVTTYPVPQVTSLDIRTLARAADGSLWVAAMTGGLYRVQAGVVTDFGPQHGLTNNVVESLYADADGGVWVGNGRRGPVSLCRQSLRALLDRGRPPRRTRARHRAGRRRRDVARHRRRAGALEAAAAHRLHDARRARQRLHR